MRSVQLASGIVLHYEDCGKKSAPTLILIMGLGAQMTIWPDALYQGLVAEGFRVIRFDNRDAGLSSQLDNFGNPSLVKTWLRKRLALPVTVPYQLEDMANDVLELMAALKIKKAHFVGASMGGMIAQILAANHRKKVLSLTSIMSASSYAGLTLSNLKILLKLARRPQKHQRESVIRYHMKMNRLIGSPAYPSDDMTLRLQATRHIERSYNPGGFKRQLVAMTASGDRRLLLDRIKAPTLVIHGADDPLIPLARGLTTAELIRKARLKVIKGMGHDFPPMLMDKMIRLITKHVKKAEKKHADKKRKKRQSG